MSTGPTTMLDVLRAEATLLLKVDPDAVTMRSCWNCNAAHEHLRSAENCVIWCFDCGHYFFKGVDITVENDDV